MKREKNKLSVASIKGKKPGLHNDGFGLNLQVSEFWSVEYTDNGKTRGRSFEKEKLAVAHQEELRARGIAARVKYYTTKSWLFRYSKGGKDRKLGLGSLETTSLARARELAQDARELLRQGIDPIDQAKTERKRKAATLQRMTFAQGGNEYIKANRAGWRSQKHLHQWTATFNETRKGKRVFPAMTAAINDMDIAAIDTPHVLAVLKPIWYSMPETASRVRARIEAVLNYAKAAKERTGDNPARWEALKDLLPPKTKIAKVKHHPALPYADIPAFMGELRETDGTAARALEFTILTAARIGESLLARWSEVDLEAQTWTVPPERMKANTGHDNSKGFGTKTREWEMDTVVSLTKDGDDDETLVMEFKKARLRTPETREQFETRKITCGPGGWTIIGGGVPKSKDGRSQEIVNVRHAVVDAYNRLSDGIPPLPGFDGRPARKVSVEAIRAEVKSRGFLQVNETGGLTNSGRSAFHRAKADLITAKSHVESEGLFWRLTPNFGTRS